MLYQSGQGVVDAVVDLYDDLIVLRGAGKAALRRR
jgi:hypothetical protein